MKRSPPEAPHESGRLPSSLENASNVLLLGANVDPHVHSICCNLDSVRPREEQNLVYLLFTRTHADIVRRFATAGAPLPNTVVVDVVPNGGAKDLVELDAVTVERVSSPSNLTEIGVALSRHLHDMEGERIVVCVRSLTALLQYVDGKQAYQFLNALTNQLASAGALAHYHLEPSAHDDQVVTTLSALFGAVIEVEEHEAAGGRPGDRAAATEQRD